MLEIIDAGADDIIEEDDFVIIYSARENFGNIQKALERLSIEAESSKLERIPNNYIKLEKNKL